MGNTKDRFSRGEANFIEVVNFDTHHVLFVLNHSNFKFTEDTILIKTFDFIYNIYYFDKESQPL